MQCASIVAAIAGGMALERSRKRRVHQRGISNGVYVSARGPRLCLKNGITVIRVNVSRTCPVTFIQLTERRSWVGLVEYRHRAHFSRQDDVILEWGKFVVY